MEIIDPSANREIRLAWNSAPPRRSQYEIKMAYETGSTVRTRPAYGVEINTWWEGITAYSATMATDAGCIVRLGR